MVVVPGRRNRGKSSAIFGDAMVRRPQWYSDDRRSIGLYRHHRRTKLAIGNVIDFIDITGGADAKVSYSGDNSPGTLTVSDGTSTAEVALAGNYSPTNFRFQVMVRGAQCSSIRR